jgi:hypothetical protein
MYGLSFEEWVVDVAQGGIDHGLVGLVGFEDTLSEQRVRGVSSIRRLCSQHDHIDGMTASHGEKSVWGVVVEHELNVLCLRTFP